MFAVYRTRMFFKITNLSVVTIAAAMLGGCDSQPASRHAIDGDDFSVSMPLASDMLGGNGVSLVAQPPKVRPEMVPAPPGKAEVRGELVPTPAGVPELSATSTSVAPTKSGNSVPIKVDDPVKSVTPEAAGPESWETWPMPQTVLFVTGNQHGYIEPCGCTGLENQKGGLARRFTFMNQLSQRGWPLVPLDSGNQVRRTGRQAEVKFQAAASGLDEMNYAAVGFGPDDLRLGVGELIAVVAVDNPAEGTFISSNVVMIDPELIAMAKVVQSGGRRIGITSALDPSLIQGPQNDEILLGEVQEKLVQALELMKVQRADFRVLLFFGKEDAAKEAMRKTAGFDLIVVAGGYGEPTYQPESIDGSATKMIVTGDKGMYTGLVGLYADAPFRYARVPLTHEFEDAPEMRRLMASYQNQLESLGLEGLGLKPIVHPTGEKFVGTQVCGECHKSALTVWENTPHALATEHLVHPGERGDISRHFDPECLSCHVTGWNAQNYYPYESGYVSLEASSHLLGNGCENCHGPGAGHAAAEQKDSTVAQAARDALRAAMRLPLENAKERCMECHDLDNSPDFHKDDAFDSYWAEIEHYGKD